MAKAASVRQRPGSSSGRQARTSSVAATRTQTGWLRQYLSRGADLRQLDRAALDAIAAELNGRPRQSLGFKTPSQAFAEALH
jgi:IS30 family transposase